MPQILVIDDTRDLREDVIAMLQIEGYEAIGAADGIEGVERVQQEKPDLIICDVMMPRLDGFGVLEVLRSDPQTATIPVIMLTAKAERTSVRQGMSLGADDYITKPFEIGELLESIQTQLEKRANLSEALDQRISILRQNIITALPHELRTPLNTVIGFSDMLLVEADNLEPEQVANWASGINKAARRLHRLVENYLLYAKLQVGTQDPARYVSEAEMLPEFGSILGLEPYRIAQIANRVDDLIVECDPAPIIRMHYRDALKVVSELTENAFKFSQPGDPVHIIGTLEEQQYTLCIEDQGRGITEEQIQGVGAYMQYDRFLHEQQGMGLGLAIVSVLSDLYDLGFEITAKPDQGTRVCIHFKPEDL